MATEKVTQPELKNDADNLAANPTTQGRALLEVVKHVTDVDGDRDYLVNKWLVCDRLWRGEPLSRYFPADKTTMIPEPYKQERSVTPRIIMALFPNEEWYRPIPERPGSAKPATVKALMDQQFKNGRFASRREQFIQNCAKYGTAFAKAIWVTDRKEVTQNETEEKIVYKDGVPVTTEPKKAKPKKFKLNRDRTEFKPLSIFDFRFDRRYEYCNDAPMCSDESSQTVEDALRKLRAGIYAGVSEDQIRELVGSNSTLPLPPGKDQQQQANGGGLKPPEGKNDIRTIDAWGLFDLYGNGERIECQITVLQNRLAVRVCKNNLWYASRPYLHGKWVPVEGEGYGLGVIEPIVHLSMDVNDMQNTLNAAAALCGNPMYKVGDGMNVMDEQIVAAPGRVFRGEDITQMQPLHTVDLSQIARVNKQENRDEISETNGTPRLFMAQMESGQESATGFTGRLREGNLRIKGTAEAMAEQVFMPFLDICHSNNQQFLDEETVVHITGDSDSYSEYKITPEDLSGVARITMALAPQIELLGIRGQQINAFLQVATQNPQVLGILSSAGFDAGEAFKTAWISEFGYREATKVWKPSANEPKHDQKTENVLMTRYGVKVDVRDDDNHAAHWTDCLKLTSTKFFGDLPADRQAIVLAHMATHEQRVKQQQEQMQQQMAAMPPMAPGAGMPGMAGPGGPGGGVPAPMAPAPTPGIQQGRVLANVARAPQQGA